MKNVKSVRRRRWGDGRSISITRVVNSRYRTGLRSPQLKATITPRIVGILGGLSDARFESCERVVMVAGAIGATVEGWEDA